jgi:polyisoprenoid-binding protein YceI
MTTTNTKAARWAIDPGHTTVEFSVRHLAITNVRGMFDQVTGSILYDPEHPEATEIQADIPAESINTRLPKRDEHLRSPEFFDVANHPTVAFRSRRVVAAGAGALEVSGDLTMRGATREVTLHVTEFTEQRRDHRGGARIGASATCKFKRSDFGMTWNMVLEAGGVVLGDEISLTLELSLLKVEGG